MPDTARPLPVEDLDHILTHTRKLWAEARGASFFITGGTGFFGLWLLESFAHANDRLGLGMRATVLTRDPAAFAKKAPHLAMRNYLSFISGDVRDFSLPEERYTHVIHAATTSGAPVSAEEHTSVILQGTQRVLEAARRAGAKRLLYVSSGAVYGPQPPELMAVGEDYAGRPPAGDPAHAYGHGKRAAEQLCLDDWRTGGPAPVIARCFAFVGPHLPLDAHFAIGNFIRDALSGRPMMIKGDGSPLRSYLYMADLAIWLWTLLLRAESGRAYNVGSGEAFSIAEVAAIVNRTLGSRCEIQILKQPMPGVRPSRYVPDVNRAKSELGLTSLITLEEAIRKTSRWHVDLSGNARVESSA